MGHALEFDDESGLLDVVDNFRALPLHGGGDLLGLETSM